MNHSTIKIFNKQLSYYFSVNIYNDRSCESYYKDIHLSGSVISQKENSIVILWKHSSKISIREYIKSDHGDYYIHNESSVIPENWHPLTYKTLNYDLVKMTDSELLEHYVQHGIKENRRYHSDLLTVDGVPNIYKKFVPVFINHDLSLTGAPIFLYDFVSYLKNKNILMNPIIVEAFPNSLFDQYDIDKYYHFNDPQKLYEILKHINPLLIYSNSINIFYFNIEYFNSFLSKTIFHFHESINNIDINQLSKIKDSMIYVVAEKIRQDLLDFGCKNVHVFPPFLPENKISDLDYHHKHGSKDIFIVNQYRKINNQKPIIGMSGTICKRKGFLLFYLLAKKNPNKDFLWVGGNSDWQQEAKQTYNTEFIPLENFFHVPHQKKPYLFFNIMDYFVLTSEDDPCPIVVLETLRLNKKVISLKNKIFYDHKGCHNSISLDINNKTNQQIIEDISKTIDHDLVLKNNNKLNGIEYINNLFSAPKILQQSNIKKNNKFILFNFYSKNIIDTKEINFWINKLNIFNIKHNLQYKVIITIHYDDNRYDKTICDKISKQFSSIINIEKVFVLQNIGWNFYGFMYGIKHLFDTVEDPSLCTLVYAHNKSNIYWREAISSIFLATEKELENNETILPKNFVGECNSTDLNKPLMLEYNLFKDIANKNFKYTQGVFFITKLQNLETLYLNYEEIMSNLTTLETTNKYWIEKTSNYDIFNEYYLYYKNNIYNEPIDKESYEIVKNKLAKNYFELYHKFGKRGIPDMHFEHLLERYVGYLISDNKQVLTV